MEEYKGLVWARINPNVGKSLRWHIRYDDTHTACGRIILLVQGQEFSSPMGYRPPQACKQCERWAHAHGYHA